MSLISNDKLYKLNDKVDYQTNISDILLNVTKETMYLKNN